MKLTTRHIDAYGGNPASIIELTVESDNSSITETITSLSDIVDENLIMALRELADELEEHNQKINDR